MRSKEGIKPRKISFVYVFLVIVTCFTLLYGWVPVFHKQAYIGIIALLFSLLIIPHYFKSRLFFITLFYALVVWLNTLWGDEYTADKTIMDGVMLGMSGSIAYYLMLSDDQKVKKWISISILIVIIIQTIPSLFMYLTAQDTIRTFIDLISQDQSEYDWEQLYRLGILAYPMTHSLPVLVPPLMMWLRTKGVSKIWKLFCFISLVCIILLTIIYDVTTVQFLILFCIAASLLIYPNKAKQNRQRVVLVAFVILPFLLSSQIQVGVLTGLEAVSSGQMKEKVADMQYNITHDDDTGDMGTRKQHYTSSLESFFWSPVIGTDDNSQIGGHSSFLDRMGAFGLLGFVPFLLIILLSSRFCYLKMPPSCRWYYIVCIISFTSLLLLKNMSHVEVWLMYLVVTPSLLTLRIGENNTK